MPLPTVMVMVEAPAPGAGIGLGLKLTVVPEGAPDVDKLMAALNPPLIVVEIADVPWFPCAALSEAGEAEMVKLGAAVTVTVTVVFRCIPPPLPVTVMGYVPGGVLPPTVIVIAELPPPGAAIVCGLKLTLVPEGIPEAERLIPLLKPPVIVVVMFEFP